MRRVLISVTCALAIGAALMAAAAHADFPYSPAPGTNKHDYSQLHSANGQVPNDLGGDDWKYAATPEAGNSVNTDARENNGIRGGSIVDADPTKSTAWTVTTGRPDVEIAVLDSGIRWDDAGAMNDVRFKIHLNRGELPVPNHAATKPLVSGVNCSTYKDQYDANGDGVFNLRDYACDSRINIDDPRRVGPTGYLTPQDLIIAFSDGKDQDHNGYVDDIAGWDFLDNDNDPYDDVKYSHGSGEATDSSAEANNGGGAGSCPNCAVIPLRVGDSFIADANRFGQAAIYATDNGVSVIQEALGTLNNTHLGRVAVDYAFHHGVAVIASAADEEAQHHNYVSSLPHTIVVNSVDKYPDQNGIPEELPKSYLTFNGCTNFSSKITVAIPSSSCSSNATGVGAGIAGLIYSAALDARHTGKLKNAPGCQRTDGSPCVLTANEVRQLMASGSFGTTQAPDGTFDTTQADDVNFLKNPITGTPGPEPSCSPTPTTGCTDPNLALQTAINSPAGRPLSPPGVYQSFPARFGFDQFYGYGRVNAYKATSEVGQGNLPPEVEITSPDWFAQIDPTKPTAKISAQAWNRGATYSCKVFVAPGSYPDNMLTSGGGDFQQVSSSVCNGSGRTARINGVVASLNVGDLKKRFPSDAGNFNGRESGQGAGQTSNGRPNSEPYGFTVRVVATSTPSGPKPGASGEDRRNFYLHRDQDMLPGFPKVLPSDGESSPAFADLDGDNRNELVFATADGYVHAMRPNGTELPGWPVHGDAAPIHTEGRAFTTHAISPTTSFGSMAGSVAIGDLNRTGSLDVVADDLEGKVYAWDAYGHRLWTREANPDYSGKPITPFVNVRRGISHHSRNRTQHGFIGSPVLANLSGKKGAALDVIAAGMDRHVYAWHANGSAVDGFPVLVVDPTKVASVNPATHAVAWNNVAGAELNSGAIIDTPAVGDLLGPGKPAIVVGTNEEYVSKSLDPTQSSGDVGNEGDTNASPTAASAEAFSKTGQLANANSRLYAIKPIGHRGASLPGTDWLEPGWPVKLAILDRELLPVVGEGVAGAPILGPVNCPSGGGGLKAADFANTGVAYVLNANGSSCLGDDGSGHYNSMLTDAGSNGGDHPAYPAVGHPAFGDFGGNNGPVSLLAPVAGLLRALDVVLPEYQKGSQDLMSAWDPTTGSFRANFPVRMNDLQFLTGPSVADVSGQGGEDLVAGSAYLDLQAYNGSGQPVSDHWPKLTSDWTVANPLIGTFGTRDTDPGVHRVVVDSTRNGQILAYKTPAPPCESNTDHPLGSWPKFHHDLANSGDYTRDAVDPGTPYGVKFSKGTLSFRAPGDDLMCGKVSHYEIVESSSPLAGATFDQGFPVPAAPLNKSIASPGGLQKLALGGHLLRYLEIRAVDDQGNVGPVARVRTQPGPPGICGDVTRPTSKIVRAWTHLSRKGLTIRGRANDHGCNRLSQAKRLNALIVVVSVARPLGRGMCSFLQRSGRFSRPQSCFKPIFVRASGKYSLKYRRLVWRFHRKVKLKYGTYVLSDHAIDQSGNVELKATRRNRKVIRLRRHRHHH